VRPAERRAVEATGDAQRLAQPSRARAQQAWIPHSTPPLHDLEPADGFEGPQEHRRWIAIPHGHRIDAPVHSIDEVDVRRTRRAEERGVAGGLPIAESMRRGVVRSYVCLHLDDSPRGDGPANA
jgi:hypothetical protein